MDDGESEDLRIRCAVCGEPITRQTAFGILKYFIHVADTIRIIGDRIQSWSDYGHSAVPNVVDVNNSKDLS